MCDDMLQLIATGSLVHMHSIDGGPEVHHGVNVEFWRAFWRKVRSTNLILVFLWASSHVDDSPQDALDYALPQAIVKGNAVADLFAIDMANQCQVPWPFIARVRMLRKVAKLVAMRVATILLHIAMNDPPPTLPTPSRPPTLPKIGNTFMVLVAMMGLVQCTKCTIVGIAKKFQTISVNSCPF